MIPPGPTERPIFSKQITAEMSIFPVAVASLMKPSYSVVFLSSSISFILSATGLRIKSVKHLLMKRYGYGSESNIIDGLPADSQLSSGATADLIIFKGESVFDCFRSRVDL